MLTISQHPSAPPEGKTLSNCKACVAAALLFLFVLQVADQLFITSHVKGGGFETVQVAKEEGESEAPPFSESECSGCSCKSAESAALAIAEVAARKKHVSDLLGDYTFYIYDSAPFRALTTDLDLPSLPIPKAIGNEAIGCVWAHRALSAHPRRTMNPEEADMYVVPAYLVISHAMGEEEAHTARVDAMLEALAGSEYFVRSEGADHLFIGLSDVNGPNAGKRRFKQVAQLMKEGYTGAFEVNTAWSGGFTRDHTIAVPYVANSHVVDDGGLSDFTQDQMLEEALRPRKISVAITSDPRKYAWEWAHCDRKQLNKLKDYPGSSIHIGDGAKRKSEHEFAVELLSTRFGFLVCGDTPTSRRTVDVALSACVPLIVGTRLFGDCETPCQPGWGWQVSGPENPHLPWHGTWFDWRHFPVLDEAALYNASAGMEAEAVLEEAVDLEGQGKCSVEFLRAYLLASRENFLYGIGDYRNSTRFGDAAIRLVETARLKMLGLYPNMPEGFVV